MVTGELAYPDTLVGTDSHTTMVNGLAVLGWGVGGIEAEAAMLGQPYSMVLPEVIGVKLSGKLKEGVTATDLVLTVTQMLRKRGVVGKFVEFFGPGLAAMSTADRATLGNMSPEYGATCGFSPVDDETLDYLRNTGRPEARVALVAAYAKAQGMYRTKNTPDPVFTDVLKLELGSVEPSLAGPKRPQDRVPLKDVKAGFAIAMDKEFGKAAEALVRYPVEGRKHDLGHGDVVIAAITSCTNTSNPSVMVAAGLLARNAAAKGLTAKPWVKTSLAPGLAGGRRVSQEVRTAEGSRQARLQSRRLRLHHLHRQFRARCLRTFPRRSTPTTSSPRRCCRATATSKAASTRMCGRTTSPRRRWSSPMPSPAP